MHLPGHTARRSLYALLVALAWGGAGCSEYDSLEGSGRRVVEACPPLTYEQFKKICNEAFTQCLHTKIQGIRSGRPQHSQCVACRDKCMQDKGLWPKTTLGKPCE